MMINPALSAPRPMPARFSAPAAASAPADQVQLSGASEPNPWPELEKAGVLAAGASLNGSIGSVISQTVREDLTRSLQRMQSAGAKLEYKRRIALPFGLRGRYEELSAEKAVDFIAKKKPDGLGRLQLTMPGVNRRTVNSLKDLQLADGILGANVLSPAEKTQLECFQSLEAKGFKPYDRGYYYEEEPPPRDVLEQMKTLSGGHELYLTTPNSGHVQVGKESLLVLDFFQGSGTDRGIKDPSFAQQLQAADKAGFTFRYDRADLDLFQAYQSGLKNAYVRKGDSILVPVAREDLGDLGKLTRTLLEADQVYDEVLAGPYTEMGYKKSEATIPNVVREGGQKFPIKVAAAVYGEMLRGSKKSGEDGYRAGERAAALAKKLYDECSTPFELARKAALVSSVYGQHGYEAAGKILSQTQDVILSRSANNPQRQEKLEDLFFTLLSASGSIGAASEGMDLVRISVGTESQEDRTRLFQAIARRLPAGSTDQAAFCYRTILAERIGSETLAVTGERFCKILEGMAVGRHQDRAAEVFTYFQQQGGDSKQIDTQVRQFLQNLVIHDDVDKALSASFGGTTSQGSVHQQEDAVVIGGVRVPRRG